MTDESLTERPLSQASVFKGRLLDVWRDEVRLPDGGQGVREYIRHPGAAVMVPVIEGERILMLRQYRYAVGQVMAELPAGKLDPGESPDEAARRELLEETGHACQSLVRLGMFHPCIGYSDEKIFVYLATGLSAHPAQEDHDEFVEPFELTMSEAQKWVRQGRITDGKTVIALNWGLAYLSGAWGE